MARRLILDISKLDIDLIIIYNMEQPLLNVDLQGHWWAVSTH
jgi:hypothetical protein